MKRNDQTLFADRFFGGIEQVRRELVAGIRQKRASEGISVEELDTDCGFGQRDRSSQLPSWSNVEANPSLLNSKIFTLAAWRVGLTLDSVLQVQLNDAQVDDIVENMRSEAAGAIYASGWSSGVHAVSLVDQARVYLFLKILSELGH